MDELGRPLYGDVFATSAAAQYEDKNVDANIDKSLWGTLVAEDEGSSSEEEEEEEEEDGQEEEGMDAGAETPSGIT